MRILVTGGCGFIGVNLVKEVIQKGLSNYLRIIDDCSAGTRKALESVFSDIGIFDIQEQENIFIYNVKSNTQYANHKVTCKLIVGDIIDKDLAIKTCQDMEVVVHLAANTGVLPSIENPRKDCEVNVTGTLNYLEACRLNKVDKFIFASSGAPLGEQEPPIHEEKVPKPISPYGASKLAGEGYCSAYHGSFGLNTVVLRFGNVYGPRSTHKGSVVAKFIKRALKGLPLEIYGTGDQTRDFIYIDDLIQAIIKAINSNIAGEIFQIATYKETTVSKIAEEIKRLVEKDTGNEIKVINMPPNRGEIMKNYSDISKAKQILGFEPQYDITKGLRESWKWFYK